MTAADRLFAEITARASRAAGEGPRPPAGPAADATSPLAALHADTVSTGRTCDGIVRPGCVREAVTEFYASGDPDATGVYCGSCFALARFRTHGRAWHHRPLPPA